MERVLGRVQVWKVNPGKGCLTSCVLSPETDDFLPYKYLQTMIKGGGVSVHHFCYEFQYSLKNIVKINYSRIMVLEIQQWFHGKLAWIGYHIIDLVHNCGFRNFICMLHFIWLDLSEYRPISVSIFEGTSKNCSQLRML